MRAEKNGVFAVVHGEFGDRYELTLLQRLGKQRIRAAAGFFGNHVIRRLEVHGIHFARLHEFEDLHRLRGLRDRKSTRLNSSHSSISYAVFCLKKKNTS